MIKDLIKEIQDNLLENEFLSNNDLEKLSNPIHQKFLFHLFEYPFKIIQSILTHPESGESVLKTERNAEILYDDKEECDFNVQLRVFINTNAEVQKFPILEKIEGLSDDDILRITMNFWDEFKNYFRPRSLAKFCLLSKGYFGSMILELTKELRKIFENDRLQTNIDLETIHDVLVAENVAVTLNRNYLIENIEDDNVYVFRCFLNCTLIIVASDFYSSIPWLDVI